jgi:hypothetical protein
MRWLEHLAGIERMKVGIVIVEALGDFGEHAFDRRDIQG